ncbi:MAG: hypothetical protein AB1671_04635 [Thermodesulfobacteriota bacterium]|jgi:hypothetical protein
MKGERAQGRILRAMGAFTENPDHLTDPDLQKRLQGEPLWDISAAFAITNDKQTGHLKEHWFGEGGEGRWWWPRLQPTEPVIRWGLIKALEKARETSPPRSIQFLWTCDGEKFEVGVSWTAAQVTCCIYSPPTPYVEPHPAMTRSSLTNFAGMTTPRNEFIVKSITPPAGGLPGNVQKLDDERDYSGAPTGRIIVAETQLKRP